MDIYQEHIMDHYANPRNTGSIKNPDVYSKEHNPLCGDVITIYGKIDSGKLTEIKFESKGCAISCASTSILIENSIGKTVKELMKVTATDIYSMLNIPISPARTKCAVLGLKTLQKAISSEVKNA